MLRKTLFQGCMMGAIVIGAPAAHGQPAPAAAPGPPPPSAAPQPAPGGTSLSLSRAVDLFRRQNLRLVAGRHQISAARADAVAAGLISNPSISLGAQFLTHGAVTGGKEELSVMLAQRLPITGAAGLRRD